MRLLFAGLAAGLALALSTSSANAQPPAGCANCAPGGYAMNNPYAYGGYSDGNGCGAGCNSSWFHWNYPVWSWITAPCPSSAPTRRSNAPLGFPTNPYARSPRDYFMVD